MKAITILQPWASLIACGAKQIETRSWATKYRGPIAIHAGKGWTTHQQELVNREPFFSSLWSTEQKQMLIKQREKTLPFGSVIAIADLLDCVQVVGSVCGKMGPLVVPVYKAELENDITIRGNEFWFGDYSIGRYAWILANVRKIEPVPAKGMQRLWEWEGDAKYA